MLSRGGYSLPTSSLPVYLNAANPPPPLPFEHNLPRDAGLPRPPPRLGDSPSAALARSFQTRPCAKLAARPGRALIPASEPHGLRYHGRRPRYAAPPDVTADRRGGDSRPSSTYSSRRWLASRGTHRRPGRPRSRRTPTTRSASRCTTRPSRCRRASRSRPSSTSATPTAPGPCTSRRTPSACARARTSPSGRPAASATS